MVFIYWKAVSDKVLLDKNMRFVYIVRQITKLLKTLIMKDEKFLKSMSRIYQGMECLINIEKAYLVGDMSICKLLTELYPKLAEIEGVGLVDTYNMSTRVKNANELYFWCSEDVDDNIICVLHDEYKYWIGQFELICKEFLARLNYDANTITEHMQMAFFEALWCFMKHLKVTAGLNLVAKASEDVIVKATPKMREMWGELLQESLSEEPVGAYISCMMDVLQKRGCSEDEILDFFSLLEINLDIVDR